MPGRVSICVVPGLGEIEPGAPLGLMIANGLRTLTPEVGGHDVVVVAQKAVSKAENRYVDLRTVEPTAAAVSVSVRTR